jgi:putative immunoreactive antigen PG93
MGNLWVMSTSMSTTATVKVLPAAKVNSANIAASDWKIYNIPHLADVNDFKRSSLAVAKGSNIKVGTNGCYNQPLVFWKNNDNDVTDGQCDYRVFSALTDQNGKSFTNWTYNHALVADSTGNVVYGSTIGLVMFNPADAFAADKPFTVTQLDELSGIEVTTIAVDKQNRKWVGTIGSGIYLVSPDCKTVLKHFTTDNSPLSSNEIYYLCCNTSNNSVFIVTPSSIMQYYADYTESASSYSNVYAYPNPVRPDFTGLITITGLMENSTVVIKDANGKIVKQLTSTGGMATWDGCDSNGERLPTGSYAVYAAQGAASLPAKPCTKVMIIK